jgi:hypothetical protein
MSLLRQWKFTAADTFGWLYMSSPGIKLNPTSLLSLLMFGGVNVYKRVYHINTSEIKFTAID